jgi:hypothetical protein
MGYRMKYLLFPWRFDGVKTNLFYNYSEYKSVYNRRKGLNYIMKEQSANCKMILVLLFKNCYCFKILKIEWKWVYYYR